MRKKTKGQFFTPKNVVKTMIRILDPKTNERIVDPACGSGGFLIEANTYLDEKYKQRVINGIEKDRFLAKIANIYLMILGVKHNPVYCENSLVPPTDWSTTAFEDINLSQFDIVVTNPPFGGEEETGLSANLPVGLQTSDTALSFLLFIMLSLKEKGRCGIILPNGPLFAGGVAAKIKKKLLSEFNLHTIIRLPETVFEPYTTVATNILFFEHENLTELTYPQKKVFFGDWLVSEVNDSSSPWNKFKGEFEKRQYVKPTGVYRRNS